MPPPSHRAGKKAFDKRLPDTEPKLPEPFAKLPAKHGTVLVVVDRPASVRALPLAVARDMGYAATTDSTPLSPAGARHHRRTRHQSQQPRTPHPTTPPTTGRT